MDSYSCRFLTCVCNCLLLPCVFLSPTDWFLQMGGLRDELATLKAAHTVQSDALVAAQTALLRAEEAAAEAEANAQVAWRGVT